MRLLLCAVAIGSVFFLLACVNKSIQSTPMATRTAVQMPPLPGHKVQNKKDLPDLEIVSTARQTKVVLGWDNAPIADADHYFTGVEGTTNLRDWYEVGRLPYSTSGTLTLTNRPPFEFYRAFNGWKQ